MMKRSDGDGLDAGALRDAIERALAALAEERKVKVQLTGAKTSIDKAYDSWSRWPPGCAPSCRS